MKQVSVKDILANAKQFTADEKTWHFHILTPECQLNESGSYALVLENTTDQNVYVCYSKEPYMNEGKQLVKLLHGDDVVDENEEKSKNKVTQSSETVVEILDRAKILHSQGISWHHHMLFPGCKFNKYSKKWVILFEDKLNGELIESVTENEPKDDLKLIETLFYQQEKAA